MMSSNRIQSTLHICTLHICTPSIYAHQVLFPSSGVSKYMHTLYILHCTVFFVSHYMKSTLPICTPVIFMWFCTTNDNYHYTRYLNKVKIIQRVWFVILTYCVLLVILCFYLKEIRESLLFNTVFIIPSFNINRSGK